MALNDDHDLGVLEVQMCFHCMGDFLLVLFIRKQASLKKIWW